MHLCAIEKHEQSPNLTSNSNLELPKLVLCFCQKLSGLMMRATWMQDGNDSCRIFSRGLMLSHLEPRISTMTVKPCLHTSSLGMDRDRGQREWEELKRREEEGGRREGRREGQRRDWREYNPERERREETDDRRGKGWERDDGGKERGKERRDRDGDRDGKENRGRIGKRIKTVRWRMFYCILWEAYAANTAAHASTHTHTPTQAPATNDAQLCTEI